MFKAIVACNQEGIFPHGKFKALPNFVRGLEMICAWWMYVIDFCPCSLS